MIVQTKARYYLLVLLLLVVAAGVLTSEQRASTQTRSCDPVFIDPILEICLELRPEDATNPVGTSHTVTAIVTGITKLGPEPVPGQLVNFLITRGPDAGKSGSCVTDANGRCTFTFTNNGTPGTDIIEGTLDGTSVTLTVSKTFVASPTNGDDAITQETGQESDSGDVELSFEVS